MVTGSQRWDRNVWLKVETGWNTVNNQREKNKGQETD